MLILYFFFTLLLTHLDVRAAKTNCGLCSWRTMKTPNADNNSCLLPRQYIILFNKNSQWVLSWFLFFCNFILLYFYHTIIYFGIFSSSNHFAHWRLEFRQLKACIFNIFSLRTFLHFNVVNPVCSLAIWCNPSNLLFMHVLAWLVKKS